MYHKNTLFLILKGNSINQNVKNISNITKAGSKFKVLKKDVSRRTLPQAYVPSEIEHGWYEWWENQGHFQPMPGGKQFNLLLPPPNVTGTLHLGHALTGTIQDVLSRWRRMEGDSVLWIPGVDHAGIATQVVVEKQLWKDNKLTKHDIGRTEFVNKVWSWKIEKGDKIIEQLRGLGLSLDWRRHVFTMDPGPSAAVNAAFIRLLEEGTIYRANGLVNWSCVLQSSISDVEVDELAIDGPTKLTLPNCPGTVEFGVLTEIAYKVFNSDAEIVIATTRPETLLGDSAIALHPDDPRRSSLEGKSVWHPFQSKPIPIIFDSFVERDFGTGAVKITPAHDATDWSVGQRHNLEVIKVFDETGFIIFPKFIGLHRYEARKLVVDKLKELGLFRGEKKHSMNIPLCSRSGDVVEVMVKPQWFLSCKEAAIRAIEAVNSGKLKIHPENYEKVWSHWLNNIRDWNISRQLWWGHPIPAYSVSIKDQNEEVWIGATTPEEARKKAACQFSVREVDITKVTPDPDVLDTWFSSSLFPLYGLGWPDGSSEWTTRYPFNLLDTGHDIIFFWVARMVMMGLTLTDQVPFNEVLFHGIICDARGRKMSKSLGNVVAPEDVILGASLSKLEDSVRKNYKRGILSEAEVTTSLQGQKKLFPDGIPVCGVDALRFTLCSQDVRTSNISFDVPTCHTNKLFCNKILQAFKFMLLSLDNEKTIPHLVLNDHIINDFDRWILSRLALTILTVRNSLENYQFHLATKTLKQFLYYELCDIYLEASKPILRLNDESARKAVLSTLFTCLETSFRLLHPFMPFITEELYQRLPPLQGFSAVDSIMIASYPQFSDWESYRNNKLDECVEQAQKVVSAVRKMKALFGTKGQKPVVAVLTQNKALITFLRGNQIAVKNLSRAESCTVVSHSDDLPHGDHIKELIQEGTIVYAYMENLLEIRKERLMPTLKREVKLRTQLEKLSGSAKESDINKCTSLRLELDKIQEIKKLLQ